MKLSQSNLEILRGQNHRTKLSLSIYQPPTLLACRVNSATITRGARTIPFDTVSSGAYTNVYANAIMYVGSALGAMDKGRIRVRSITASSITVAENSDIDWADNLFLTIVDFIEISAIYPRIIKDPNSAENVIFYKDYDVPHTNQNSVLGTLVCMGSHRAADLDNGSVQLYWTSSGTYNVKGDSLTYLWNFGGAASGTSTVANPGYVTYTTPGHYKTKLTVSNASGTASDISYRYVSIYSPASPSIPKWELQNLSGSRDSGGYTASIKIYEDITLVHPNALIVIYADDWYGTNHVSLGGNQVNNSKTVFVGYIIDGSIKYNYEAGWAEFQVGSPTEIMKLAEGFSISVESKVSPTTWFQLANMTTSRAVWHYLKFHSTVPCVTDVRYVADNRLVQYFDADRSSLFDAIDNFLKTGMIGGLISDRQGSLWAEINPPAIDNSHSLQSVLNIEKRDWMNSPNIGDTRTKKTSFVEMGGIVYNGATLNTFTALLSNAPGTAPSYQGKTENLEGLILTSQIQLNTLAGNYLEYQNATYPDITMDFAGNYRNLDIAPVELVNITLSQNDTFIKVQISSGTFHIVSMDWMYNSEQESFLPRINFHELTEGIYAETILIPPVPPDTGYTYPDYNYPNFPFNPLNIPPIIIPEISTQLVVVAQDRYRRGLFYTFDFESSQPTWIQNNAGMASGTFVNIHCLNVTSIGSVFVTSGDGIWYAPSADSVYTKIITQQMIWDAFPGFQASWTGSGYTPANIYVKSIGYDKNSNEDMAAVFNIDSRRQSIFTFNSGGIVSTSGATQVFDDNDSAGKPDKLSFGAGYWVLSHSTGGGGLEQYISRYTPTYVDSKDALLGSSVPGGPIATHYRVGISDTILLHTHVGGEFLRFDTNNGQTQGSLVTLPAYPSMLVCDTLQTNFMSNIYGLSRSSDGGVTWEDITANLPANFDESLLERIVCLDSNKWIIINDVLIADYWNTGNNILFTEDFGTTWSSRMGNLPDYLLASGTVDGYFFNLVDGIF